VDKEVATMKLQQRGTIIVVIVFVFLAAWVYFVEIRGREEVPAEEGRVSIFSFEVEDVVLLEVRDKVTDQTVTVRRGVGELWRMTEPFAAEADDTRVEGLLSRLSRLESTRVIEGEEIDLEAFGLVEPSLEVELGLEDGESQVLLVGVQNPAGYSHYVRRQGQEVVYLVGSSTTGDLERLIAVPPEKPTPVLTETLQPTIIVPTATVPVTGTATVRSAVTVEPTSTVEN
jgi:hypothetical protein